MKNLYLIIFQIHLILLSSIIKETASFWFADNSLFIAPELRQQEETTAANKQAQQEQAINAQNNNLVKQQEQSTIIELSSPNDLKYFARDATNWNKAFRFDQQQQQEQQQESKQVSRMSFFSFLISQSSEKRFEPFNQTQPIWFVFT